MKRITTVAIVLFTLLFLRNSAPDQQTSQSCTLEWSIYLGGSASENGQVIATDGAGHIYIAGTTDSEDFPTTRGYDTTYNGGNAYYGDAFLAKFGSDCSLVWSTFLGGSGGDTAYGLATDGAGNVYITGSTSSDDFPSTRAYDSSYNGGSGRYGDAFLAKFSPDGALVWATYLGGGDEDVGYGVATDGAGNVYVAGMTRSADFPIVGGFDATYGGDADGFVAKFSAEGALVWSTYIGGSGEDRIYGIGVDVGGNVCLAGRTVSEDLPTSPNLDATYNGGGCDTFVSRVSSSGELLWTTYLGGGGLDPVTDLSVDDYSNIYVTGATDSSDFPTSGILQSSFQGGKYDIFVTKYAPDGSLVWSRYLGRSGRDEAHGISVSDEGNVFLGGYTSSPDFPTSYGEDTSYNGGVYDAIVSVLDSDGELVYSSFVGGSGSEEGRDTCLDRYGNVYLTGLTDSLDFPVADDSFTIFNGGGRDGFLAKFSCGAPTSPPLIATSPTAFLLTVTEGTGPATRTLWVWNAGGGTLRYSLSAAASGWAISLAPASGESSGAAVVHTVLFDTAGLLPGGYNGTVFVEGNAANSPVAIPVSLTVEQVSTGTVNLAVSNVDVAPTAPVELRPGDPLVISAFVENLGDWPSGPFWVEVWGSRTGGLILDRFLARSLRVEGGLAGGGSLSWVTTSPLCGVPDGPYTVVYAVDRPGEVAETDERDNRAAVAGKRILVIRPQTGVDLAVEGFSMSPNPAASGQPIAFSGRVVNRGHEPSGPFWIEFWGSWERPYPARNFFLCDSILVENLDPGAAVELSNYPRRLYNVGSGVFMVGCFADRDDAINELDETNNYQFVDGEVLNPSAGAGARDAGQVPPPSGPDIVVLNADFSPSAPARLAPGTTVALAVDLSNIGDRDTGPFWVEYWGSRDGGVTLTDFLADSDHVANLAPGQTVHLSAAKPLYSVPDGPYTVVAAADRPGEVAETNEANNRAIVAGKRILVVRPRTGANLTIENFQLAVSQSLRPPIRLQGTVSNVGTADSGPFWIEFWACSGDPDYPPWLERFLAYSIRVENLGPGEKINLADHPREFFGDFPAGRYLVIGFVDRPDQVAETDETDNYAILRNVTIVPPHD